MAMPFKFTLTWLLLGTTNFTDASFNKATTKKNGEEQKKRQTQQIQYDPDKVLMSSSIVQQMHAILDSGGDEQGAWVWQASHSGKGGKGKGSSTNTYAPNCGGYSGGKGKGKGSNTQSYHPSKGKGSMKGLSLSPLPCPSYSSRSPTEMPSSSVQPTFSPTSDPTPPPTVSPSTRPTSSPSISFAPTTLSPTSSQQPSAYDCASPAGRNKDIKEIFANVIESLEPDTPQSKAFNWITLIDTTNACDGFSLIERYILAVFYFSTAGHAWGYDAGWLSTTNHCNNGWYGITCDADGRVDEIKLQRNNLNGQLPVELGALESLRNLRFFDNNLYGTIPIDLYNLPYLNFLDFEQNSFSGQLFVPALFNATTLVKFRMSDNNFNGNIPSSLGLLTGLRELWFASNQITGTIPNEITNLNMMEKLIIYNNPLTGTIPNDITLLTELDWLDLSLTNITGSIPSQIGNLQKLRILILESMSLTGELPSSMSDLFNLEELLAKSNEFTGPFPDLSNLTKLGKLVLSDNNLSGSLSDIGPVLEFLDARDNSLGGTIPDSIFSLNIDTLSTCYLSNNTFTGTIPSSYANVKSLRDLWLDGNDLTGTIPDIEKGDLPLITEILFDQNRLSGPVPDGICALIETIPDQFFSLHADCYPRPGTDIPNNPCACCTDCSIGKENNNND